MKTIKVSEFDREGCVSSVMTMTLRKNLDLPSRIERVEAVKKVIAKQTHIRGTHYVEWKDCGDVEGYLYVGQDHA